MKSFFSNLNSIVIGSSKKFDLEKKLFHIAALVALLVAILSLIINIQLNFPIILNSVVALGGFIFLFVYIKSRFFNKYYRWLFIISGLVIVSQTWFLNEGLTGSINYVFILALVVFLSILPKKQHLFISATVIVLLFILHYVYFKYPQLIKPYPSQTIRVNDILFTFVYVIILTALVFSTYRSNYEKERKKVIKQNNQLELKNTYITDSIDYASDIQQAFLQDIKHIEHYFTDHFLIWHPKDIVSGDFYLFKRLPNSPHKKIAIIADCTGHGVPGAMLTMLGLSFLRDIIANTNNLTSSVVLQLLREQIINAFTHHNHSLESNNGIDAGVCIIDYKNDTLDFAGAHRPLYIIRDRKMLEYSGDRMTVGKHQLSHKPFTPHAINIKKDDMIYMFTDGYTDQFGKNDERKFYTKNLKRTLLENGTNSIQKQGELLNKIFIEWKGSQDQTDDVLVFGFRYNPNE